MDAVMYEYRYFMEKLLLYDNVELYFFPGEEEIVCDLDFYADTGHYNQSVNKYMKQCFALGKYYRITEDNLEEELQKLKDMVDGYDYDALLAERE